MTTNTLRDKIAAQIEATKEAQIEATKEAGLHERVESLRDALATLDAHPEQPVDVSGSPVHAHQAGLLLSETQQPAPDAVAEAWQPIETAPKDGSKIDLWGRNLLHYDKTGERIVNVTWGAVTDWTGRERDDWRHGRGEGFEPTHWMPLPAPPALASGEISEYVLKSHAEAEKQAAVSAAIEAAAQYVRSHNQSGVNYNWAGMADTIRSIPAPTDALDRAIEAAAERAFKDGIAYATICEVSDPDEAWRTSACRAAIRARSDKGVA